MRGIRAGLRRRRVLLLGASAVGVLVVTGVASAESFTVTTPSDSNDGACTASLCSLCDAVVAADQAGTSSTITLPDMNVDSSSFTDNDATTPPAIDPGQMQLGRVRQRDLHRGSASRDVPGPFRRARSADCGLICSPMLAVIRDGDGVAPARARSGEPRFCRRGRWR